MNGWRWILAALLLTGLTIAGNSVLSQEKDKKDTKTEQKKDEGKKDDGKKDDGKKDDGKKDDGKKEEPKKSTPLSWTAFRTAEPFYQTLVTKTKQTMKVMDQSVTQEQDQTFYFKWTPKASKEGEPIVVDQEIIGVKMTINIGGNTIKYDSMDEAQPKNPMTEFFNAMVGSKFTLTIDPKKVTDSKGDKVEGITVEGVDAMVSKLTAVNKSMEPLLQQILSKDAVKQMAFPMFGFLPADGNVSKDSKWEKTTVLNLGPIGTYTTKNDYSVESNDGKVVKMKVKMDLQYKAPTEEEIKASKLPFKIEDAKLGSKDSSGTITFDSTKGLISSSESTINLEGELKVVVASSPTNVTLAQTQTTSMTTSATDPTATKKKS